MDQVIKRKLADGSEEEDVRISENPMFSTKIQPTPKIIEVKGWTKKKAKYIKDFDGTVIPRYMVHQYFPEGIDLQITGKQIAGGALIGVITVLGILALAGGGRRTAFPAPSILGRKPSKAAAERGGFKTAIEEAMEELILGAPG